MPTYSQLLKKKSTRVPKKKKCRTPLLKSGPHRKAVCVRVYTTSPKKPNSAVRKVAKVKFLISKKMGIVYVPGQGHTIGQHSVVLVRGGRVRDVPGVHYKMIRNKLDFTSKETFLRKARRSKFGLINSEKHDTVKVYFKSSRKKLYCFNAKVYKKTF
jgi:small subunit ribosomal protein S12